MAIAWSSSLQFTTENASKSIVGSTLSGEGVVNVYRGTGKVLVAPTMNGTVNTSSNGPEQTTANSGSDSLVGSIRRRNTKINHFINFKVIQIKTVWLFLYAINQRRY